MKFADLASGSTVFIDANIFVYALAPNPQVGPACLDLLERVEYHDLHGFFSTHVLSDIAHRLMSLEACATFGWPFAGIAQRLKRHPTQVRQLTRFNQAIETILALGVQIIPVSPRHIVAATTVSQQTGLLSNDALITVLMRENSITQLASNDADFDGIFDIQRFEPS